MSIAPQTLTRVEAIANTALDAGDEMAGTVTTTVNRAGAITLAVAVYADHADRLDYWVEQVRSEVAIARHRGRFTEPFAVVAATD